MLSIQGLQAWYGKSQVLRGVDMEVGRGEIVALLGRNGAGRSTTLKAVMGGVVREGRIRFGDTEIGRLQPHQVARLGLGYVPEDRSIFPDLTTAQNLILGEKRGPGAGGRADRGRRGQGGRGRPMRSRRPAGQPRQIVRAQPVRLGQRA